MMELVADLTRSGLEVSHPLLERREQTQRALLLVLTANRGLCGGFNSNVVRLGQQRWRELDGAIPHCQLEVSGKRGIGGLKFRGLEADVTFTHFEDRPEFGEVEVIANRYLDGGAQIAPRLNVNFADDRTRQVTRTLDDDRYVIASGRHLKRLS